MKHADTKDALLFPEVWKQIAPQLAGLPLVAHNQIFDEDCLKECLKHYEMPYPDYPFYCTLKASRAIMKELNNHQLHTVSDALGYHLEDHHHALADTEACAHIALALL